MATPARLVLSLTAALALVGHPATRIPAGVRTIDIHSSRGVSREVTDQAKVAKIVRWFDALPKAPRGVVYSVGGHPERPVLQRRFLVRVGRLLDLRLVPVARP